MENKKNNNDKQYHFAVCKTCFWTATLLRIKRTINNDISNYDSTSISCPVCFDHQSISLIPPDGALDSFFSKARIQADRIYSIDSVNYDVVYAARNLIHLFRLHTQYSHIVSYDFKR